mgnify:FL=1
MFTAGMMNGKGTMKFADGTEYEGSFVDGAQSGSGMMVWPNDSTYDGLWADDKMTSGVLTVDGGCYTAELSNGDNMVNGTRMYTVKLLNGDGSLHRECRFKNGKLIDME